MSKKADQRKIKEEKQAAAKRSEARNSLLLKWGGGVFALLVVGVLLQGLFTGAQSLPPDVVSDADHVRGNTEADVTLTVYADFQCPACQTETTLIQRAWPQIGDKVQLVFRHYPLDTHRHAFLAARYAEAAGRQDKFWQMHDQLYGNQVVWSNAEDASEIFDDYAEQLGLDMEKLKADVDLPDVRAKIVADQRGGTRAGVRATPSLFVNGRLVSNPANVGELVDMVNAAAGEG